MGILGDTIDFLFLLFFTVFMLVFVGTALFFGAEAKEDMSQATHERFTLTEKYILDAPEDRDLAKDVSSLRSQGCISGFVSYACPFDDLEGAP